MRTRNIHRKSQKRMVLSFWQTIGHYSFMLVPLMMPGYEIFYKLSGRAAVNTIPISTHVIFLLTSLAIGYFKWRELTFYELSESRTDKQFKNAVCAAANKLNWSIDFLTKNKAQATGFNSWKSKDLHSIKIERHNNKVLINSMVKVGFLSSPDFYGSNRTNINTFLDYYYQSDEIENINVKVLQDLKDEEERIENEPEWSLKNTIKRIIAYFFSFGFWALAFAFWKYEGFNIEVLLLGIVGSGYIIFDIYVMWTKSKKSHHNML